MNAPSSRPDARDPRVRVGARLAMVSLAMLGASACARQEAPSGGAPDRLPPIVLSVSPQPLSQATELDAPIRIQFNERISERTTSGLLNEAVIVSPESGEVDVEHKRDALLVNLPGGLVPGAVYRVTVLPVVRDMFGNRLRDPFEFVFSTGGTLHQNAVVGMAIERVTGRPVRDLLVQARQSDVGADTTIVYPTRTDSTGSYALRYLPPGGYALVGFQDRNRNRTPDRLELQAARSFRIGTADTVFLDFAVLEADTTPARLARAEVAGAALVRLRFDDFLDPESSLALIGTTLRRSDGEPGPAVRQILHEHRFLAIQANAASADTTVVAPAGGARMSAGETAYQGRAPGGDSATAALLGLTLPSQVLYAQLSDTLAFAVEHVLKLQGVTNLRGVTGGPDSVRFVREAPPTSPPRPGTAPRP